MKTALVTGGGSGLGKGFVECLLDLGFVVFAGVKNPSKTELKNHKNLKLILLDVSSDVSISHAVEAISKETKHLNLLINNARVNKDTATNNHKEIVCSLPQLDRNSLLQMLDVNAVSPLILIKHSLPLLKEQDSFVINISSDRASFHDELENSSGNYGYRASKIALNMLTFCSVWDLPKNVKTFAVHPGSVKTHMKPEGKDLPYEQAKKIISITQNWKEEFNGKFLRYDGTLYPL